MNIWQLVYFLIVPGTAWIVGVRTAIWYTRREPVGFDIIALIFAAIAACIYLLILTAVLSGAYSVLHLDLGTALHNALCPLCSAAATAIPAQ